MEIFFHRKWGKQYGKLDNTIQRKVDERIVLFQKEPDHPLLNNHPLSGEWEGFRSINITGDYRAIYQEVESRIAMFYTVDTHSNLYG